MKYEEIGKRIREYREKLKLTQQELADKVGVTWEMVSRYERGKSSPFSQIDTLSKALNTEPAQLLQKNNNSSGSIDIPLFISIPNSDKFISINTRYFYPCPRWIYERDPLVFALENSLIDDKNLEIAKNGIIYIAPNVNASSDSIIIYRNRELLICSKGVQKNCQPIGIVIAQEIRYL